VASGILASELRDIIIKCLFLLVHCGNDCTQWAFLVQMVPFGKATAPVMNGSYASEFGLCACWAEGTGCSVCVQ
jgi:hypothetical protein